MLKKWVVLIGLVCASACAISTGRYTTVTFASTLRLTEEHYLVGPHVARFETNTMRPYFKALVDAAIKRGQTVYAVNGLAQLIGGDRIPPGFVLWGYNDFKGNIYIESSLSIDEGFSTLVHELGHSLQPEELKGTPESQVWAEALGYVVCQRLGLDTRLATFPYLQNYPTRHEVLRTYARGIDQHATQLVKEIRGK